MHHFKILNNSVIEVKNTSLLQKTRMSFSKFKLKKIVIENSWLRANWGRIGMVASDFRKLSF